MCVIKCQINCIWFWGNYNFSTFANISSRALCHSLYSIMVSQTLYSLCLFCLKFTNLSTSRPRQKPSKRQMMTQWGHCITFCVVVIDDRGQGGGCDLLLCNHIGGSQKVTFLSGPDLIWYFICNSDNDTVSHSALHSYNMCQTVLEFCMQTIWKCWDSQLERKTRLLLHKVFYS